MKKVFIFIIISALCLPLVTGCFSPSYGEETERTNIPSESIHTEREGIYLTLESITDSSLTVIWHNETDGDVTYGEWYSIEKFENGEWVSVMTEEMTVAAIALLLPAGDENEKTYSTAPFNITEVGLYRLRCEFSGGHSTWVEFAVAEKDDSDQLFVSPAGANIAAISFPSEKIIALLNDGEWVNDLTNCAHDFVFTLNDRQIRYHSECGTFTDIENTRSLTVSDSDKEEINSLLGSLFEDWDDSWE